MTTEVRVRLSEAVTVAVPLCPGESCVGAVNCEITGEVTSTLTVAVTVAVNPAVSVAVPVTG